MTSKSTALVNFITAFGSIRQALSNCKLFIFGGTMPTGLNAANTGSGGTAPLCTITNAGNTYVPEVLATWGATMSNLVGEVGLMVSIGGMNLMSAIVTGTVLNTLVANVAAAINNRTSFHGFSAGAVNGELIIVAPSGSGDTINAASLVISDSGTGTIGIALADGGDATLGTPAEYGLQWLPTPSDGVIQKGSEEWLGTIANDGTATWFMITHGNDTGLGTSTDYRRIIGSIGTSGAALNLTSTILKAGATITISDWSLNTNKL